MKKDFEALNEAYAQSVQTDRIDEAVPAVLGAVARAAAPAVKQGVQQGVATGVASKISGENQPPQQLNASANKLKQFDSLNSDNSAGKKIDDSLRENYKKMIEDGVAHMVESNCDDKSPLTFQEGYQYVKEYADNKLLDLNENQY